MATNPKEGVKTKNNDYITLKVTDRMQFTVVRFTIKRQAPLSSQRKPVVDDRSVSEADQSLV